MTLLSRTHRTLYESLLEDGELTERERLRIRALLLLDDGHSQSDVSRILDLHHSNLFYFIKRYRERGFDAFQHGKGWRYQTERDMQIVGLLRQGFRLADIALRFGISQSAVSLVKQKYGIAREPVRRSEP